MRARRQRLPRKKYFPKPSFTSSAAGHPRSARRLANGRRRAIGQSANWSFVAGLAGGGRIGHQRKPSESNSLSPQARGLIANRPHIRNFFLRRLDTTAAEQTPGPSPAAHRKLLNQLLNLGHEIPIRLNRRQTAGATAIKSLRFIRSRNHAGSRQAVPEASAGSQPQPIVSMRWLSRAILREAVLG